MADPAIAAKETLARTPLYDLHVAQGARMVPFAGYAMPVQYKGVLASVSLGAVARSANEHSGRARHGTDGSAVRRAPPLSRDLRDFPLGFCPQVTPVGGRLA